MNWSRIVILGAKAGPLPDARGARPSSGRLGQRLCSKVCNLVLTFSIQRGNMASSLGGYGWSMNIQIIKHIYMQIPRQPLKFFGTMISSGLERQFIPADPRAAVLPEELIPEGAVPLSGQGQPDYCLPFDLDGVRFHWN